MAVPRMYRVLRGERGDAAKAKLLAYYQRLGPEVSGVGTRGNRPASAALYVVPFGQNFGTGNYLQTSALVNSITALRGAVGTHAKLSITAGTENGLKLKGVHAARVSATSGVRDTGTPETSKLTGLHYASYGGKSTSMPFGRTSATANEKEEDVFEVIKADLGAFKRVHLIRERI
jgi:hypothetical protein